MKWLIWQWIITTCKLCADVARWQMVGRNILVLVSGVDTLDSELLAMQACQPFTGKINTYVIHMLTTYDIIQYTES